MKYVICFSIFLLLINCLGNNMSELKIDEVKFQDKELTNNLNEYIKDISSIEPHSRIKDIVIIVSKENDSLYYFDLHSIPYNEENLLNGVKFKDIIGCQEINDYTICYFNKNIENKEILELFKKNKTKITINFKKEKVYFYDSYNATLIYSKKRISRNNNNLWWYKGKGNVSDVLMK